MESDGHAIGVCMCDVYRSSHTSVCVCVCVTVGFLICKCVSVGMCAYVCVRAYLHNCVYARFVYVCCVCVCARTPIPHTCICVYMCV